jgi:hypothetical protein
MMMITITPQKKGTTGMIVIIMGMVGVTVISLDVWSKPREQCQHHD